MDTIRVLLEYSSTGLNATTTLMVKITQVFVLFSVNYIEDIAWPRGEVFRVLKIQTSEQFFDTRKETLFIQVVM